MINQQNNKAIIYEAPKTYPLISSSLKPNYRSIRRISEDGQNNFHDFRTKQGPESRTLLGLRKAKATYETEIWHI